eukprot:756748-Hanusia_phi.AAC.2
MVMGADQLNLSMCENFARMKKKAFIAFWMLALLPMGRTEIFDLSSLKSVFDPCLHIAGTRLRGGNAAVELFCSDLSKTVRQLADHAREKLEIRVGAGVAEVGSKLGSSMAEMHMLLRNRRSELGAWGELTSCYEDSISQRQMWINPLQGWSSLQQAVDEVTRNFQIAGEKPQERRGMSTESEHFAGEVPWPATLILMMQDGLNKLGEVENKLNSKLNEQGGAFGGDTFNQVLDTLKSYTIAISPSAAPPFGCNQPSMSNGGSGEEGGGGFLENVKSGGLLNLMDPLQEVMEGIKQCSSSMSQGADFLLGMRNGNFEGLGDMQHDVRWVNDHLVEAVETLLEDKDWQMVSADAGINIWRKYLPADMVVAGKKIDKASKFACVKAQAVIDAPLEKVYDLFVDNSRVREYNEYCKEVRDLEWLDENTKVHQSPSHSLFFSLHAFPALRLRTRIPSSLSPVLMLVTRLADHSLAVGTSLVERLRDASALSIHRGRREDGGQSRGRAPACDEASG